LPAAPRSGATALGSGCGAGMSGLQVASARRINETEVIRGMIDLPFEVAHRNGRDTSPGKRTIFVRVVGDIVRLVGKSVVAMTPVRNSTTRASARSP
jgi:hypothetical protein